MSVWHRPQLSLVRKKSDGIKPPVFVWADEGKNGLSAPAPSSAIIVGTSVGFSI